MPNERKAYENHYVTPSSTFDRDRFRCTNVDSDIGAWMHVDWLPFNYCPFCGQELEDRLYDPEHPVPPEGI